MSFKPFFRLLRDGRLTPLLGVGAGLKSFYKLTYLAAAGEARLLNRLASGPATLDSLAEFYAAVGQGREALEAWLQMGTRLRLLSLGPRGYVLRAVGGWRAESRSRMGTFEQKRLVNGLTSRRFTTTSTISRWKNASRCLNASAAFSGRADFCF
jgi:hypothetical protein